MQAILALQPTRGRGAQNEKDAGGTMIAFVFRRLFQALLIMLAVGMVAFALFRYVGDPIESMAAEDDTAEFRQ